jgi:hypothetical protein
MGRAIAVQAAHHQRLQPGFDCVQALFRRASTTRVGLDDPARRDAPT